jgi:hypothetical protein
MKTKLALCLALLCVCIISGCTFNSHLYPVQGPLAAQTTPPIFTAKITGTLKPQSISAILSNGEVFKGIWTVPSVKTRTEKATEGTPAPTNLASEWDIVYGQGYYTAHVLGTRFFAQTVLTGNQGTVLQMEMYRQEHGSDADPNSAAPLDIRGVAKDSKGNIYKLAF